MMQPHTAMALLLCFAQPHEIRALAMSASLRPSLTSSGAPPPRMMVGLEPTTDSFITATTALDRVGATTDILAGAEGFLRTMPTTGWTIITTMAVLMIGQCFELATHAVRHSVPKSLLPVIEVILGELTTLGFSGLLVGTLHASSEDSWLGRFSEHYLGEAGELFELFESADRALFPTTVAFVGACGLLISVVNQQFDSYRASTQKDLLQAKLLDDAAREACENGADGSNACKLARRRRNKLRGVMLESMHQPGIDGTRVSAAGALRDLFKPSAARRAEFLRFRARFIEQGAELGRPLPDDFLFGKYLQLTAANNLKGLVSVEPVQLILVWVPLILAETAWLTVSGGVDGDFLPQLFGLAQLPIGVWALWNYMRIHDVKTLLTPQLGVSTTTTGEGAGDEERSFKLLPPRYALLGGALRNKRSWMDALAVFERLAVEPARTKHDECFGVIGANGPAYYLGSMKLVLFSSVVSLAYFGSGGGDVLTASVAAQAAACLASDAAPPDAVCRLADGLQVVLGQLAFLPSALAVGLAPFTFLSYNFITSVEGMRKQGVVDTVLREQRADRFQSTLASLGSLCEWIEPAVHAADDASARATLPTRTEREVEAVWDHLLATKRPEKLLDVRALFEAADKDASGSIGLDEVSTIIAELGYTPTAAGLRALFGRMDVDGSGEVSFIEFCTAVLVAPPTPSTPAASAAPHAASSTGNMAVEVESNILPVALGGRVFDFFDTDGSGCIDEAEMLAKLKGLGFDSRGVSLLFEDVAGAERDVISRSDFMQYIEMANTKAEAEAQAAA